MMLLLWTTATVAHEIRPAVVDASLHDETKLRWSLRFNLEAALAGISSDHDDTDDSPDAKAYNQLRELDASSLENHFALQQEQWLASIEIKNQDAELLVSRIIEVSVKDAESMSVARDTIVTVETAFSDADRQWTWQWIESYGPTIVRYTDNNDTSQNVSHYLEAGAASPVIKVRDEKLDESLFKMATRFITLGFIHIIPRGLDHILFVLGLVLLHPAFKPVLLQVTLFTIAHSITLALATLGFAGFSIVWVEAAIAASIVYIALDNLRSKPVNALRLVVVFLFGLLHGFGFASVLSELSSAGGNYVVSLAAFNVGVELGQLAVVLLFFLSIGYWCRDKSWYGSVVRIPCSLLVGVVGLFWFLQRTQLIPV